MDKPIIGQEAICPDGVGLVTAFDLYGVEKYIQVATYIRDRSCKWSPDNVELVPLIRTDHDWYCGCGHWNGSNLATCAMCGRTPAGSVQR